LIAGYLLKLLLGHLLMQEKREGKLSKLRGNLKISFKPNIETLAFSKHSFENIMQYTSSEAKCEAIRDFSSVWHFVVWRIFVCTVLTLH